MALESLQRGNTEGVTHISSIANRKPLLCNSDSGRKPEEVSREAQEFGGIRDGWSMLRCVWKLQQSITGYRSGRQTQGRVPMQSACSSMARLIAISQHLCMFCQWASVVAQIGKESDCNAGEPSSIPGQGMSPGGGHGNHSSILALKILWTEEPGGLQSIGSQRVGHD